MAGGRPCAVSEADSDGDATGAADRSLTCDEVLARVGCSDVVELVGPGVPPPRRARFLGIMTDDFHQAVLMSCCARRVVNLIVVVFGWVFVWHIDQLQPTQPNPYVMAAETHVCSLDSPLGKIPPGTPPRAPRYRARA